MKLSILICTVPERAEMLEELERRLHAMRVGTNDPVVEMGVNANTDITTGAKRNDLIENATGDYIVFIDDDDWVPDYYVEEILKATESNPDCIGMKGYMTTNGESRKDFEIRLGHPFQEVNGIYLRHPNHISPIKRELALQCKFPDKSNQEDYEWSCELKNKDLLKTEVFIDKDMYHYRYSTKNKLY